MKTDRRNPYVILGVPFGASEQEARSGFAAKVRALRAEHSPKYMMEDLNWALHQIEQLISDPSLVVDVFRIPANPEVLLTKEFGAFNPRPHTLDRRNKPSSPEDHARLRQRAIAERLRRELRGRVARSEPADPYMTEGSTRNV